MALYQAQAQLEATAAQQQKQAEALKTATVNLALIESTGPGRVHIPVEAVKADVTFTEEDLGSYTISYQDGDWFLVD